MDNSNTGFTEWVNLLKYDHIIIIVIIIIIIISLSSIRRSY
jgi:hypothetical protein